MVLWHRPVRLHFQLRRNRIVKFPHGQFPDGKPRAPLLAGHWNLWGETMKITSQVREIYACAIVGLVCMFAGIGTLGAQSVHGDTAHVPGRLLVRFRADVSVEGGVGLLTSRGARSGGEIPGTFIHVVELPPQ